MKKTLSTKKSLKKKTLSKKNLPVSIAINRRKEWRFELPLSTLIEGKLPDGKNFQEVATLENISSGGAYFCLDSGVIVGSKLNLIIDIPKKITEGKKVKLQLGGITVRLEKPDKKRKKQGVAVRFNKEFKFLQE